MDILKKINWKQPKYMIPLIIYFPLLFVGYFVIDLFHTEKADIPDKSLATTEYLNPELPDAKMKARSYGQIDDFSAIDNIDRNNEENKEEYNSKYTDAEREQLKSQEAAKLAEMQRQLQESAQKGQEVAKDKDMNEAERIARSRQREQEAMEELNKAIAQARLQGQQATISNLPSVNIPDIQTEIQGKAEGKVSVNDNAKKKDNGESETLEVVKKVRTKSDYFNTLCDNDPEPSLIKAIIDENVKVVDGSRVRLRLLDDIEINEVMVPKGTYIYAIIGGLGSQRVKGTIKSIMIDDDIVKVNLSLYDTDGLEGLYVPNSNFRDTSKDVASGAMSNTSTLTSNNGNNGTSLTQWGTQAITNAVQKTSNAIGKAVKKKSVKLKYGTHVYLINGREKKN